MTFQCLFNSTIKEGDSTDIALGHSLIEITSKKLGKKEAQFNYFDRSYIWGFGNVWHQDYGKTQWRDLLSKA